MRNEIRLLTALELRSLYGWNKFRHSRDAKYKRRYRILTAAWLLIVAMILFYAGALVYGLCMLGLGEISPAFWAAIASMILFFLGIFQNGSAIFSPKGYDLLVALPLRHGSIVYSRFLRLYVEELILTLAVLLPGMVVYGYCLRPGLGFYLMTLLGTLFLPLLPLTASTAVGALVTALSSRMKHKSIAQSILSVAVVLAITIASSGIGFIAEDFTLDMLLNLAKAINTWIGRLYPPAVWFGNAAVYGKMSNMLLLIAASLVAMLALIAVVSRNFQRISRRLFATSAKHNYRMGEMKRSSMLAALCRREARRYFASSIYVTNTIIGPLLGCILCGALCFMGAELLQIPLSFDLRGLIPFALAGIFTMMTPSSVALSMEGKQLWIAQSLPIPAKALLDAKLLFNLLLMLPFWLIAEAFLIAALKPAPLELLWLILIPTTLILFAVTFGLWINLKLHSFDWEKEEAVVKQSASAGIGGFVGFLASLASGAIAFFAPYAITKPAICTGLILITALLYRSFRKIKPETL